MLTAKAKQLPTFWRWKVKETRKSLVEPGRKYLRSSDQDTNPKLGFLSIFEYYLGSSVYVSSPYITIRVWMNWMKSQSSQLSSGSSEWKRVKKKSGLVFSCRMDPSKRGWGLTFYRPFSGLVTDSIFSEFALCSKVVINLHGGQINDHLRTRG